MKRRSLIPLAMAMLALLTAGAGPVRATQYTVSNPTQFNQALNAAGDGDEILLSPGIYASSFYKTGLVGVTIRSLDPGNLAIIDAVGRNEGLHLSDPLRVTVQDLIVRNALDNGINIDDAGTFETPADQVTLRNVTVLNTNPAGNHDGIKLSGVDNFHVDRVHVDVWGGSAIDMVGCHYGLIENSLFTNGPASSGEGVRPKGGSNHIIIRANRFVDGSARPLSIGGSTGLQFFRPQPPGTVEADNVIAEGNVVVRGEAGVSYINIDGGIDVRYNYFYRPQNWVIRILKENIDPGFVDTARGIFTDNVIVWNEGDISTFVNIGPNTLPATFTFARNQWYNQTNPANSTPLLPAPEPGRITGVDPGLNVDGIIPWDFNWGLWLVNANDAGNVLTVASPESLRLATPEAGAELDLAQAYPLIGQWSFSALAGADVAMAAFSQAVLIDPAAIPDWAKVPGDANVDGLVDGADYTVWADHYKQPGNWAQANFNGDSLVDGADYTIWADHFTGGGAAVPEPAAMSLLLAGACAALLRRKGGLPARRAASPRP